jgi:hypothetical protein
MGQNWGPEAAQALDCYTIISILTNFPKLGAYQDVFPVNYAIGAAEAAHSHAHLDSAYLDSDSNMEDARTVAPLKDETANY